MYLLALLAACDGEEPPADGDSDPPPPASGGPSVFVNEVMAQNVAAFPDDALTYPDWIELWNGGDEPVDLSGWWLSDDRDRPLDWTFPDGTTLEAGAWLVVFCDGDASATALHATFHLDSEGGEDVILSGPDADGNPIVDALDDMGPQSPDVSLARMPDGGGTWSHDASSTPGEENE